MNKVKLQKIQNLFQGVPDKVPKGWYTAEQLVKITGKQRSTISSMLSKHLRAKSREVKVKNFNIKKLNGIRSIPHYQFNL